MSTILVKCPNGHRFPINPKKHLDRRERFCPRCKAEVKVRGRLGDFMPNPDWLAKKEGSRNAQDKKRAQAEAAERLAQFFGMLRGRRHAKAKT